MRDRVVKSATTSLGVTTIFYQHGDRRKMGEARKNACSACVRLVSPEILHCGEIRISFFWAIPGWADRGRRHIRVSSTVADFGESGRTGLCNLGLDWLLFRTFCCTDAVILLSVRQMEKATYGLMFHNTTAGTAALQTN